MIFGKKVRQYRPRRDPLELHKKMAILGVGAVLVLISLVAAGFGVYKLLGRSVFFQVTSIKIQGCKKTDKDLIFRRSGIDIYTNLLSLDVEDVKKRLESHEWIKQGVIKRDWPNGLIISVKERVPVVMANLEDGLYYLDEKGIAFAAVSPPDDMDFPVITGLSDKDMAEDVRDTQIADALTFVRHAGRGDAILPKQNISEINLGPDGELTLFLVNRPFPIHLGKGKMRTKSYRLAKVLYWLYKKKEFASTAYIRMDYQNDRVLVGKDETG